MVAPEVLVRRLTKLSDEALRLGYPFTAEHLKRLVATFIEQERMASIGIGHNIHFPDVFDRRGSNATSALPGWTTEGAICGGLEPGSRD